MSIVFLTAFLPAKASNGNEVPWAGGISEYYDTAGKIAAIKKFSQLLD
jgi:hypothetical protein